MNIFTTVQAIRAALADIESLEGGWDRLEAAGGFAQFFTQPNFDLEVLEVNSGGKGLLQLSIVKCMKKESQMN